MIRLNQLKVLSKVILSPLQSASARLTWQESVFRHGTTLGPERVSETDGWVAAHTRDLYIVLKLDGLYIVSKIRGPTNTT